MDEREIEVERWLPGEVAAERLAAAWGVGERAFAEMMRPRPAEEIEAGRKRRLEQWVDGDGGAPHAMLHVALADGEPAATATTFARTVIPEGGEAIEVLALSGVAVEPSRQGGGLGEAVVRDAFARLGELGLSVCLYQTGLARGFYERMGARCVDNWFFDGTSDVVKCNPWTDRYVMIYPGDAAWPTGAIDLNGGHY
ncbi:MAG: GNAT family N-acetyltransferase [Planctomycetota bacterium]